MRHSPFAMCSLYRNLHRASKVDAICLLLLAGLLALGGLTLAGCAEPLETKDVDAAEPTPEPQADALRERLEDSLRFTYEHRHLNLNDHAAWQILHGVLTYKEDFLIKQEADGEEEFSAVEHILSGGEMKGWTIRPGQVFTEAGGRRGMIAELESGSGTGQGHYDQWLAVLAQCDLPADTEIRVGRDTYTMQDFVNQVMYDVPNRRLSDGQYEYSWTLIGLAKYVPTEETWIARDGETWSLERLVKVEAAQARDNLALGACGGTHRLIGLTMALQQHLAQDGELTGGWAEADEVIQNAITRIHELQNNNGTLSTNWLEMSGVSSDVAERLSCTGHQLEFLTLALTEEQLQDAWVKRAVASLCLLFEETQTLPLECGALYHASHGLDLYHRRVYGTLSWNPEEAATAAPTRPRRSGATAPPPPPADVPSATEEPADPPAEAAEEDPATEAAAPPAPE